MKLVAQCAPDRVAPPDVAVGDRRASQTSRRAGRITNAAFVRRVRNFPLAAAGQMLHTINLVDTIFVTAAWHSVAEPAA